MGFYLRKSFRMGPLRFNLSKGGLGASLGVTGLRLGLTSRGRAYVHAGRGGVYLRKYLGGRKASESAAGAGGEGDAPDGPIVLYEHTGVTYGPGAPEIDPHRLSVRPDDPSLAFPIVLSLLSLAAGGWAWPDAAGSAAAALALLGALLWLRRRLAVRRALGRFRAALSELAATKGGESAALGRLERLLRDPALDRGRRTLEARRLFLVLCGRAADDGEVTEGEKQHLDRAQRELPAGEDFCRDARADAFRGVLLAAVADHELSDAEQRELEQLRKGLGVARADVDDDLRTVDRLAELRDIQRGELPEVEASVPLHDSERCHFEEPGRLLREKQLRRFQRDRQRYVIRGLVVEKEGRLLVTSERVLLVRSGTTSIRHHEILRVEVDADESLIHITKDGRESPILLTTPDADLAAAMIARLAGC